jgi:hypothetical protein
VLTKYQRMMLEDLSEPNSYGQPLIGWIGHIEFYRRPEAPTQPTALTVDLAETFVDQVYFLVSIQRIVRVYRGFETAGLRAPYGEDHPSFIHGLVQSRCPGTHDGLWWTPARPSKSVDRLHLSEMHRAEDRTNSAVTLTWNRLDFYLEAELRPGSLVYVGRTAPQQERALYGSGWYSGGAMQFRITVAPQQAFLWMKRYAIS